MDEKNGKDLDFFIDCLTRDYQEQYLMNLVEEALVKNCTNVPTKLTVLLNVYINVFLRSLSKEKATPEKIREYCDSFKPFWDNLYDDAMDELESRKENNG